MIVAIDGPAASGKGTLARRLAAALGYPHLDTGLLYRAVGAVLIDAGIDLADAARAETAARGLDPDRLDEARLRAEGVGEAASIVAAMPAVRSALLDLQRDFAHRPPGAVLDGRDIGSVVCPDAEVKLFVTASPEERARRRAMEMREAGEAVDEAALVADIIRRDARDSERAVAPLKPAADAILLDTTNLDIEAAFRAAFELVGEARLKDPKEATDSEGTGPRSARGA